MAKTAMLRFCYICLPNSGKLGLLISHGLCPKHYQEEIAKLGKGSE